jgi:hypothetical protein
MDISTYQVQYVLRVYTNQLKSQRLDAVKKLAFSTLPQDEVTLSTEGKKKQLFEEVLSQAVGQFTTRTRQQERARLAENLPGDTSPQGEGRELYGTRG